jgi:hypothetical protein
MKNKYLNYVLLGIYVVILVFLGNRAFASDCTYTSNAETVSETTEIKTDVPKFLEGATIIVRLANGTETVVPAEKFKVVPRKQQFLVAKTYQLNLEVCTPNKNRFSYLAGKGTRPGLRTVRTDNEVTVESKVGAVGGLQYQRLIYEDISVGAQVQTNDTVLVNIGLDF